MIRTVLRRNGVPVLRPAVQRLIFDVDLMSCPSITTRLSSIGWSVLFLRTSAGFNWRGDAAFADSLASLSTALVRGLFLPGTRTIETRFPCLLDRTASRTSSFH